MPAQHSAAPSLDYVSAYAAGAADVVSTVAGSDLGASVPTCPGWSTYDLVMHLGNVHAWAASVLETRAEAPRQNDEPESHRAKAVARWYEGKAEDLLAVLRDAPADEECWSFSRAHRDVRFWQRRQAHEVAVHLADLRGSREGAPVLPGSVTPELAADGALEVLEVFLPRMHDRGKPAELSAPLLLHATDTGDSWLLTPLDGGPPQVRAVSADETVADATDLVAAPAAELMLLLWHRLPATDETVALDGDRDRILAFLQGPLTA